MPHILKFLPIDASEGPMTAILVADDDMDIRDLVAFKLEQAGYEVVAVDNGLAALTAATENPPDLVVLDVMMPGMSGIDVCRQLRQEQVTKALPIILLTARAQEGDVEVGFGAGADDYIVKPFSPRELVSRVEAVLARMRT
jgi:two-component system phosphate regulon response regulator PhoB